MKTTDIAFILLGLGVWLCHCPVAKAEIPRLLLAPKETVSWPPQIERIAEDLYKNKVAAMAAYNMRLREYDEKAGRNDFIRGKAFLKGIQELGETADDKLLEKAKELEGSDFIAKLILLARDRKARPEKHEIIWTMYLDFTYQPTPPGTADFPPMTNYPPKVGREHLEEEWRLPLEYAFFAPPTAPGFKSDSARYVLSYGIAEIKNLSKTNILMIADAASAVPHLDREDLRTHQVLGFAYVVGNPNAANAAFLDAGLAGPDARNYRRQCFENMGLIGHPRSTELPKKRPEVWERWETYFKDNPANREKAKKLAELIEEAAAEGAKRPE